MSHWQKPEGALRKAHDLIRVNQESEALKVLHAILINKRSRTWQSTHEKIMFKYVELAVGLRKNVRDALNQYKNLCHTTQLVSLEKVLVEYLRLSNQKAADAKAQAEALGDSVQVDDLEDTPESVMLQAVSGENQKDRKDRQLLTPAVKYLWETYRTTLEVLRNNNRMEEFYHQTAREAARFCVDYSRALEFRRLCESLRSHINTAIKYQAQTTSVDLSSPATQQLYLTTRFEQLNAAAKLELWQEAYRTMEDINADLQRTDETVPPRLMKVYYHHLAHIFWTSNNYLFHAYSLHQYYTLAVSNSVSDELKLSQTERNKIASKLVLAALIIRSETDASAGDFDGDEELFDNDNESNLRLASLLGIKREAPSRANLLALIADSKEIMNDCSDTVKGIHRYLETHFGPLSLKAQLEPLIEECSQDEEIAAYMEPLEELIVIRLLQQLSRVFTSIRIAKFQKLAPSLEWERLERLIVDAVANNQLNLRIDHRNQKLIFPSEELHSARLRRELNGLAISLGKVVKKVVALDQEAGGNLAERRGVFAAIRAGLNQEHQQVFRRQELIENRKQQKEQAEVRKQQREEMERQQEKAKRRAEEKKRLAEAARQREAEARARQDRKRELAEKKALADRIKAEHAKALETSKSKAVKEANELLEKLEEIKTDDLLRAQREIEDRKRAERERVKKEAHRKLDYLTRAYRKEEQALIQRHAEQEAILERERHEIEWKNFCETHRSDHNRALVEKKRFSRMAADWHAFRDARLAVRKEKYHEDKKRQNARLKKAIAAARAEEEEKRRAAAERREREERERQEREAEEARKEQQRQERLRREEEAAKEAEAKQAKLDEIARRQREREAELEARDRESRSGGGGGGGYVPPGRRNGGAGAGAGNGDSYSNNNDGGGRWEQAGGRRSNRGGDRGDRGGDDGADGGGRWRSQRSHRGNRDRDRDRDRYRDNGGGGGSGRFRRSGGGGRDGGGRDGGRRGDRDRNNKPDDDGFTQVRRGRRY